MTRRWPASGSCGCGTCAPEPCTRICCGALHNAAQHTGVEAQARPGVPMPHNVIAVYPGTFDPMTLGHEDVVRRATQLFPRVIVAVAAGHHKKSMFTLQERIEM